MESFQLRDRLGKSFRIFVISFVGKSVVHNVIVFVNLLLQMQRWMPFWFQHIRSVRRDMMGIVRLYRLLQFITVAAALFDVLNVIQLIESTPFPDELRLAPRAQP